ncbi:DUF2806 domain-containing protein [Chryseobacterium sp. C-71]|uniref:DUF2806 domain-containing protein n=1 Tax=Chryseobacterium sp. C-71 TaxID=2893882 RepID=UPI001E534411|nr:DUF2806 domain-containing protein [Chryseobacterium sp. C-71]UFH32814.1 DUF2806 domain-containing protein [Chryseobacterium sp. C-71]
MENNENNSLENIVDAMTTIATGIPAPIQKNFWTSVGKLCTAAVDIPVAYLEGQADLRRANTEARKLLIGNITENMSDQIEVPEVYSIKAVERFASKIIKQQINLDQIVSNAANNLAHTHISDSETVDEISEDWLNSFEEIAKLKSSDDMRLFYGKLLSNEISNPGSFSLKTINVVSQLDSAVASIFLKFCNASFYIPLENKVPIAMMPVLGDGFKDYTALGILYHEIQTLQNYGLIHSTTSGLRLSEFPDTTTTISHGKKEYYLETIELGKNPQNINPTGYFLSIAGLEIMPILDLNGNLDVLENFSEFLKSKNIKLTEKKE